MLKQLPTAPIPKWLEDVSQDTIADASFPVTDILKDSLYYPSSGLDGDPIRYLVGNILSFVYVDHGYSKEEFEYAFNDFVFSGYKVSAFRSVSKAELTPNGWVPSLLRPSDGNPAKYWKEIEKPFCSWSVFERDAERTDSHGPRRFSFLYLCADGPAAFEALYPNNRVAPKAIAIIQPGNELEGNWTDYEEPRIVFGRTVMENIHGQPGILLFGGIGERKNYERSCWPQFKSRVCFLNKQGGGSIGVWQK